MIGIIKILAASPDCKTAVINACSLPMPAGTSTTGYLNVILNIVFAIAASVAVLLIVINGLRYITARGDPGGTASAKNGVVYSLVGLLVVMVAYSIVIFIVKGVG